MYNSETYLKWLYLQIELLGT